jgi:UDP-glucose 4-epimerase
MKVLVTGGAGFIGSHVAKKCLEMGFETIVLDDLSGGFPDNIPEGATFAKGSINDEELINSLFTKYQFDYVYHLAAYAAEGLSHFIRRFNYQNNLIGSINLINASVNAGSVKRFVFTSSIAVYGSGQLPMTEEMKPEPEDPYGVSKYAVELDLKAAHEMFGLDYTIFRPHNVYGENQNMGDRYRNVIGIFMNQIMKGEQMTIFGDGLQTRAFSHIDDVAPIIAESVTNSDAVNEIFNVGANNAYTVKYLAEIVAKSMGSKPNIQYLKARNEVVHAFSDHSKVEKIFTKKKYIELVQGIEQMSNWAIKNGPRKSSAFSNIEIRKNMPPSWADVISE